MFNKRKENLFLWEGILDIDFLPFVYIHFLSQLILLDCFEQILCARSAFSTHLVLSILCSEYDVDSSELSIYLSASEIKCFLSSGNKAYAKRQNAL